MRLTTELRDYVRNKVSKLIPEPLSAEAYNAVRATAENLIEEFQASISEQVEACVKKAQSLEIFKGCSISTVPALRNLISIATAGSPAAVQYRADCRERSEFVETAIQKTLALLSTQKEVEDLDKFIENVVTSIK